MSSTRVCLALVLATVASADAATMQMSVRPGSILLGTSADIIVTVRNEALSPLRLDPYVTFRVLAPTGEEFVPSRDHTTAESSRKPVPDVFLSDDSFIVVGADTELTFSIPFFWPTSPFRDPRFADPGRYEIVAAMRSESGITLSAEATSLFVTEPRAVDLEVWNRIVQDCGEGCAWSHWQGLRLDQGIVDDFPGSSYAAYVTGYDFRQNEKAAVLRAIGMTGPYREHILLFEADTVAGDTLADAIFNRDPASAVRAVNEKKRLLDELIRAATDPFVKAVAVAALAEMSTTSDVLDIIRELSAAERRPTKKLRPIVSCVEPKLNQWVAWFGYENPFAYEVWLGVSTGQNKFEPKPHERGQPETFKMGGEARAFSVEFDGSEITWFVRGEKAVATKDFPRKCN